MLLEFSSIAVLNLKTELIHLELFRLNLNGYQPCEYTVFLSILFTNFVDVLWISLFEKASPEDTHSDRFPLFAAWLDTWKFYFIVKLVQVYSMNNYGNACTANKIWILNLSHSNSVRINLHQQKWMVPRNDFKVIKKRTIKIFINILIYWINLTYR